MGCGRGVGVGCSASGLGPAVEVLDGTDSLPLWGSEPAPNEEARAGVGMCMREG